MTDGPDETRADDAVAPDDGAPVEPDSNRRWRILALVLGALAVILVIVLVLALGGDDDDTNVNSAASKSTTSTKTTSTTSTTVPGSTTLAPGPPGGTTAPTSPSGGGGGNGGGGGGTTPTEPTAPPTGATTAPTSPTGPIITSYTASPMDIACPAPDVSTTLASPTVTLTWTTQNATGVDISVDGPGVYGSYGPNGNTSIIVPCNGATHTYTLTAKGAGGQTTSQTRSVATHT